jgi:flagellar hook-basal body complex protein FliE
MIEAIQNLKTVAPLEPLEFLNSAKSATGGGAVFQSVLDSAIQSVQKVQTAASSAVGAVLEGKGGELHSAILATQRAELQFQLFLQYRNKIISAYQEVMKVQI